MTTARPRLALFCLLAAPALYAQWGGVLRMALRSEPKTLHPLAAAEESSETVRYLTSGVLIRINRGTQRPEAELALRWKITETGRVITFDLRPGLRFSDGTSFASDDIVHTFRLLSDPNLRSPAADSMRIGNEAPVVKSEGPLRVSLRFPSPVAGIERLFDGVSILSARSPRGERATLGPFQIAAHQPGEFLRLERNPFYWKIGPGDRRLPYLDAIRLEIMQNRELELLRFRRGEFHLISRLEPEMYHRLKTEMPDSVFDAGPSPESEQMWFNMADRAPIAGYKKEWFRRREFRNAVSLAIRRQDLARIAFAGLAVPAAGPLSGANLFWFNQALQPRSHDPAAALALLARAGFRRQGAFLSDAHGNRVQFTLITNAGNKTREKMAALIQQDLTEIGIRVQVVPLDFPSLIERITKSFNYDACLLGLVNVDLDPNGQKNIWLSSAANHQWNPGQVSPATEWEAEIDRLMLTQATVLDPARRKEMFNRVQRIAHEQEPFIYLVYRKALMAASPLLRDLRPAAMFPNLFWNLDQVSLVAGPPPATE